VIRAMMLLSTALAAGLMQPTEPDDGGIHDVAIGDLADDRSMPCVWWA
jgi:hypothetical protein